MPVAQEDTVYDATFAALARTLGATFVTADERLVHRLEPLPFVRFLGELNLLEELKSTR
jgi:predicted nucleic acid-binding protein